MVVAPLSNNDSTQSMMDSARVGLDYIVENGDYVQKLASALESKNFVVKKQVFELLSALCVYSSEGYGRTLQALEYFKVHRKERHRFKFVITELQNGPSLEYQTAVLAFINCFILATPELRERIRVRSEFIGLKLLHVLYDLRHRNKDHADLVVQLDVFDEQRESDESQVSPTSASIDLSSPLEVFDALLRQIADTPQEVPFLSILQHLLRIDPKEPVSDLIWDSTERLVHRATLLESSEDARRLLKSPSHAKSLHKLKGGDRCACTCHGKDRKGSLSMSVVDTATLNSPPPPPPPPVGAGPPPPPPPPMFGGGPPPPPPPAPPGCIPPPPMNNGMLGKSPMGNAPKQVTPQLPQQAIPMPKSKMRTVNWNKIPSGQVLQGDKNNIWATLGKSFSKKKVELDWAELEGLFCIQNEKGINSSGIASGGGNSPNSVAKHGESDKKSTKKEACEVTLLDAKRSLNINIFLKQFRSSNEDMIRLIVDGCSEDFGAERLRGLLKILPTKDEMEMLKSVPAADKGRLGSAEKFLLEMIQVNGYRLRIEAMLLKEELETWAHNLESSINAILQASQDVKQSHEFQEVIFMILVAGNFLNSGGYAGDAAGVKLSSLQKIVEIRGNKPGISLLHFIAMHAEVRNPKLITFVDEMVALEEASKTSIDQLKGEILALKSKVTNVCQQMQSPAAPKEIASQFGLFFQEANIQIATLEDYLVQVEDVRVDLARFFCEDMASFKFEDCFKILYSFTSRWKMAAVENGRRKKQEEEAESRKKAREEQLKKRIQITWQNQNADDSSDRNKPMALNPEDDIFIACSPRIVRRRLGSFSDNPANGGGNTTPDQLTLPSPDTTPNGSLRRRRSRVPSDEDESGLMDFLRSSSSSTDAARERRPGAEQYGSLDRSWSRKGRRRPNLMDFVNDERERPISPAPPIGDHKGNNPTVQIDGTNAEGKHENPTREWRERIAAWFVDLENGGSGEIPKRRPPPRRFQRRLGLEARGDAGIRGLATLPEGEVSAEEGNNPNPVEVNTYQRVYQDRKPSITVNTDVVGAMEAIEEVQVPVKEKSTWRRPSLLMTDRTELDKSQAAKKMLERGSDGRRSFIGSLGTQSSSQDEKLVLYIPKDSLPATTSNTVSSNELRSLRRSPSERDGSSENYENSDIQSGTKEGFDRFASIRRSRRYKKGPDASPAVKTPAKKDVLPVVATPSPKFVSKVDISSDAPSTPSVDSKGVADGETGSPRNLRVPFSRHRQRNDPRSASTIEPRHVHLALGRAASAETKDLTTTTAQASTTTTGPTTTSSRQAIPTINRESPGYTSKVMLSSSPGSTERDEGFEESHSSLSETNSQSEATIVSAAGNKLGGGGSSFKTRSNFKSIGGGQSTSDIDKTRPNGNHHPVIVQSVRKRSLQENSAVVKNALQNNININNNQNNNKNSSRSSLQSSRSSLTSQTTVNTVREAHDGKARSNSSSRSSDSSVLLSNHHTAAPLKKPFSSTASLNNNNTNSNNRNVNNPLSHKNNKNESLVSSGPNSFLGQLQTKDKDKSSHKGGLTPRILSFMRPTASSQAKDKVEPPPKIKGVTVKKSFK